MPKKMMEALILDLEESVSDFDIFLTQEFPKEYPIFLKKMDKIGKMVPEAEALGADG